MTDDLALAEERLRAVLTARAADIPAKDLHDRVVRRARRRRITVVAVSAIAVAAVAADVPAALAAVRSDPAPPPDPTARPVPAPYQPGSITRACAQLNTQGMARRSSIRSDLVRLAGREPILSPAISAIGVIWRKKARLPR